MEGKYTITKTWETAKATYQEIKLGDKKLVIATDKKTGNKHLLEEK